MKRCSRPWRLMQLNNHQLDVQVQGECQALGHCLFKHTHDCCTDVSVEQKPTGGLGREIPQGR